MNVQVGIFPYFGKVSLYDSSTKKIYNFDVEKIRTKDNLDKIDAVFKTIATTIKQKHGSLCIFLFNGYGNEEYSNKIRKRYIQAGCDCGFTNVEIIDWRSEEYLNAISQSKYIPKNDDIIWIYNDEIWYIWKKINGQAIFITQCQCYVSIVESDRKEEVMIDMVMRSTLNEPPTLMLYKMGSKLDVELAKKMFPCSYMSSYGFISWTNGALLKARILANDAAVTDFNVGSVLDRNFVISDERGFQMISIQSKKPLPYKQNISFNRSFQKKAIQVKSGFMCKTTEYCVSLISDPLVIIDIVFDTNGIYFIETKKISLSKKYTELFQLHQEARKIHLLSNCLMSSWFTSTRNRCGMYKHYRIPEHSKKRKLSIVGTDFGTSKCCAAVHRRNGIETVALDNTGERLLPSYVSFDEEKEKCGQIVVNRLQHHDKSSVYSLKAFIANNYKNALTDEDYYSKYIQIDVPGKRFKLDNSFVQGRTFVQIHDRNEIVYKNPEDIFCVLLQHIKEKCDEFQGKDITEVVIAVPTSFTYPQRVIMYDAALIGGWKVIHLLPEPIAAIFAYFIEMPILTTSQVFIFDLGGSTLDICTCLISDNSIEVKSEKSFSHINGTCFDNMLLNHIEDKLLQEYGIKIMVNQKYKLQNECKKIKENLSLLETDCFDVDNINISSNVFISVTRKDMEFLSIKLLQEIYLCIAKYLLENKIEPYQIDKVFLVGGGCRMPMIKELLKSVFMRAEHLCDKNPDEITAIGAAHYGGYLLNNDIYRKLLKEQKQWLRMSSNPPPPVLQPFSFDFLENIPSSMTAGSWQLSSQIKNK